METAVYSAIIEFNGGKIAICKVAKQLGLKCGYFMINGAFAADKARVLKNKEQSGEKSKKRRKRLRAIKKGFQDKEIELEGKEPFASGSF